MLGDDSFDCLVLRRQLNSPHPAVSASEYIGISFFVVLFRIELLQSIGWCTTDDDSGGDVRGSVGSNGTAEVPHTTDACFEAHLPSRRPLLPWSPPVDLFKYINRLSK